MAKDKSKSGRKIGRNKKHQAPAYKAEMRYERNRKKRWRRTLANQPGNLELKQRYEDVIGPYQGELSGKAARKLCCPRVRRVNTAPVQESSPGE